MNSFHKQALGASLLAMTLLVALPPGALAQAGADVPVARVPPQKTGKPVECPADARRPGDATPYCQAAPGGPATGAQPSGMAINEKGTAGTKARPASAK